MPFDIERFVPNGGGDEDGVDEINPVAHAKLVDGINSLTGSHYIREVTRTEPTLMRSEFGLAKTKQDKVHLGELKRFFTKTKKHTEVVKQLEKLKDRHPLEKPLEKTAADRIQRKTGFQRVQRELNKWEAMVQATDVAPQTVFPLRYGELTVNNVPPEKLSQYRVKTKLMESLEELEKEYVTPGGNDFDDSDEEEHAYKLTVEEIRQQQMDRARRRQLEYYQIAKGRRVNKIKSKKYHRLLKKDKLKEQMKKFEELKEKDPQAAMRQLDQIEKQRFEERATLRHKNTGTWAKNLQVRATYDMDVRRELAEQLAIGRELTAKRLQENESSSDTDGEQQPMVARTGDNPWVERRGDYELAASEQNNLTGGYRKYWEERNRAEALKKQLRNVEPTKEQCVNGTQRKIKNAKVYCSRDDHEGDTSIETNPAKSAEKIHKKGNQTVCMASGSWDVEDIDTDEEVKGWEKIEIKSKLKSKKKQTKVPVTVEELFQEAEELIQDALSVKLDRVQRKLNANEERERNCGKRSAKQEPGLNRRSNPGDLSFKKKARLGDADVEMNETVGKTADDQSGKLKSITLDTKMNGQVHQKATAEINPTQVVQMKPKHLLTALPDTIIAGELSDAEPDDDDDGDKQRLTIAEAFQDDDIVADFAKEKRDERARFLPQEVNLELPGWGHWAGPEVAPNKPRKNARNIFQPPTELPRRDDDRDRVIINEDALVNPELSKHLVNELPFPYVTVKDYEASLRAPLGRSFIPETAHGTMIEPRIVTKQGTVIEPMKKEMLLQNPTVVRQKAGFATNKEANEKYGKFIEEFEKKRRKGCGKNSNQ